MKIKLITETSVNLNFKRKMRQMYKIQLNEQTVLLLLFLIRYYYSDVNWIKMHIYKYIIYKV